MSADQAIPDPAGGDRTSADHTSADLTGTDFYELRLYVAGQSPRSVRAVENLRQLCERHLSGRYRIELVDLLLNPKQARTDQIVALPTLVRTLPEPIRKIIGDLSDHEQVLVGLQVLADGQASP